MNLFVSPKTKLKNRKAAKALFAHAQTCFKSCNRTILIVFLGRDDEHSNMHVLRVSIAFFPTCHRVNSWALVSGSALNKLNHTNIIYKQTLFF